MKKIVFLFFILLAGCAIVDPSAEVSRTLNQMNQAYKDKNIEQKYRKKDGTLIDPQTGVYRASVYYFRSAKSPRYGVDNQSGETTLTFVKDENGLKLIKMPDPGLYGLIVP